MSLQGKNPAPAEGRLICPAFIKGLVFCILFLSNILFSPPCLSQQKSSLLPLKTDGFTKTELAEIRKDGYMSYFYRRKYSPGEIGIVWHAVNTLMPDYSKDEKLLAARSILAYHWVVYRTTVTHNMKRNVAITKQYQDTIGKMAKLHGIPPSMAEAVITWENSGGLTRESWAACVGVGQLSKGAVSVAHDFYKTHVKRLRTVAKIISGDPLSVIRPFIFASAEAMRLEARLFDVEARHAAATKLAGIKDCRFIPHCNIEDAVIYLKLLWGNYGNRVDLAISAYHNGGLNNNDIIRSHLNRNRGTDLGPDAPQTDIIAEISRMNLGFIHLWQDSHSRDMLNGLRTVYGETTAGHNSHLALGDESDIYLWKVAAAYGALYADDKLLNLLMDKYKDPWDIAELKGMIVLDDREKIRKAIKAGWLVRLPAVCSDGGIGKLPGASREYLKKDYVYNYYVSPETAGFLLDLSREYRRRAGNPRLLLPVRAALESKILQIYPKDKIPPRFICHLQGAAVDIDLDRAPHRDLLYGIIKEWFLHDRIYFTNKTGERRITVNPRYGRYYYSIYRQHRAKRKK